MPIFFSLYLDILRIVAALAVFTGHIPFCDSWAQISVRYYFGYDAVIIFFVLSGYVISYAAEAKEKTWERYITSRMARILPVSISAILLGLLTVYLLPAYKSVDILRDHPLYHTLMSLTFLNQVWWLRIQPIYDPPYWSLAFEVWNYILFGIMYFMTGRQKWFGVVLVLLVTGPKFWLIMPTWFAGNMAYRCRHRFQCKNWMNILLAIIPVIIYTIMKRELSTTWSYPLVGQRVERFLHHGLDGASAFFWAYILTILVTVHLHAVAQLTWLQKLVTTWSRAIVQYLAGCSFSLYLFHFPLYILWSALLQGYWENYDPVFTFSLYFCILGSVALLSRLVEKPKANFRAFFLHGLTKCKLINKQQLKASQVA